MGDTWYQRNKEKAKAQAKAYQEANKEKFRAYFKEYYQKNKEKLKARHALWVQQNRDHLNKLNREVYNPRYRAKKQSEPLPPIPITPLPPVAPPLLIEKGSFLVTFE